MSQRQTQVDTCVWTGISGKTYTYYIYPIGTNFTNHDPANYIFARHVGNTAEAIYVGQTEDISERFDNHHAMPCITRHQATHVHVHLNHAGLQARLDEETDIRQREDPPCNRQ